MRAAKLKRLFWLDLVALSRTFLRPGQLLTHVHYFTSRIRGNGSNAPDQKRQSDYLDALATLPELTRHEGHFLVKKGTCHRCHATWTAYEEKMSDVNLAVQLLLDAVDSDLATPIQRVLHRFPGKRIIVAFPPRRHSATLAKIASGHFSVGEDKLRKSQLPDPVVTASGIVLHRPPTWR